MTTLDVYKLTGHMVRPGHLPESAAQVEPVNTHDPQSAVDRCLNCTKETCFGTCGPYEEPNARGWKCSDDKGRRRAVDAKVAAMLDVGYSNYPICRALGISEGELRRAKGRIRYWKKKNN